MPAIDALLAVWNGKASSRGTIYTIKLALSTGKRVFLITSRNGRVALKGEITADGSPFARGGIKNTPVEKES